MNKKNTTILILALIVLVGAISVAVIKIRSANTPSPNAGISDVPISNTSSKALSPSEVAEKQADFAGKAQQGMVDAANKKTAEFVGKVNNIAEKNITIKDIHSDQSVGVKVNSSTKIFLLDATGKKQIAGSLADLLLQDQVKAEYDKETNNLVSLVIAKVKK
jgi:hypothetical protein